MPRAERAPSFQFYPLDWLGDGAVQAMSFDQQGRYLRGLCMSWNTSRPGVASEDEWRRWMQYSRKQWERVSETMAAAFDTSQADVYDPDNRLCGTWIQKRMVAERERQVKRYQQAALGAERSNAAQGRG